MRRQEQIKEMVKANGLLLQDMKQGKSGHIKVQAAAPNGMARQFVFALTPSDRRGDLNNKAELKRFYRASIEPTKRK